MKKLITIFMILSILFLVGCQTKEIVKQEPKLAGEGDFCDAKTACAEGLECWRMPGAKTATCNNETIDACELYCGPNSSKGKCVVMTSYPPQFGCEKTNMNDCNSKVGSERNKCFRDLAIEKKDSTLCENTGELKGVCYRYIAIFITKDVALCNKIPDGSIGASKEECVKSVSFQLIPATKEDCIKQGGLWNKIGIRPTESCNIPTSDAGKICIDSSQCESSCIGENKDSSSGKCSEWKIVVGCYAFVEDGKADVICAD